MILFCLDDEKMWRDMFDLTFQKIGLKPEEYRVYDNPINFVNGLNRNVGVAVIDHRLLGISGLEIMHIVKQKVPWCRCIIISATEDIDVAIDYINSGRDCLYGWVKKDSNTALENLENLLKDALPLAKRDRANRDIVQEYKNGNW